MDTTIFIMTNPSLFLLFLTAAGIGGFLLATFYNASARKNKSEAEKAYPYYPGVPPVMPATEKRSKSGLAVLPFVFFIFTCSMLYVLYSFNTKLNDLEETRSTQLVETDNSYGWGSDYADKQGQKERRISVGSSNGVQPRGVYHAVAFNAGWGIELINDESSLQWLEEYERALAPFFTRHRTLLVETTVDNSEVIEHRFYLGPFDTREDAIKIKERLNYLSPQASIVPLKDIDNLQAFQVQAPGA
jgi:hypothetical protein